jgi:alpha-ribazole phosphatase
MAGAMPASDEAPHAALWCFRHPRCEAAAGRCIGRTDVAVDPRRARRLAHRIRDVARRHGLPREAWVSPLRRCRRVGDWLRRWGWQVRVDARLLELDFGSWEGRLWTDVPWSEVADWERDLLWHAPGGGECLADLRDRVRAFTREAAAGGRHRVVVTHGGWLQALRLVEAGDAAPAAPDAANWPPPPRCGSLTYLPLATPEPV